MRGKGVKDGAGVLVLGITPAYAGKSRHGGWYFLGKRDHPRACGEKTDGGDPLLVPMGSPPRMRGKVAFHLKASFYLRITPAHAGKRYHFLWRISPAKDHPRACGEKGITDEPKLGTTGSPPRMRGKGNNG